VSKRTANNKLAELYTDHHEKAHQKRLIVLVSQKSGWGITTHKIFGRMPPSPLSDSFRRQWLTARTLLKAADVLGSWPRRTKNLPGIVVFLAAKISQRRRAFCPAPESRSAPADVAGILSAAASDCRWLLSLCLSLFSSRFRSNRDAIAARRTVADDDRVTMWGFSPRIARALTDRERHRGHFDGGRGGSSGAGTDLKVGGTGSERKWGHRSVESAGKNFLVMPLHFFGSKSKISRFGERFCDGQYSLVSFLFAILLTVPPCPAICRSWGHVLPVPHVVGATGGNADLVVEKNCLGTHGHAAFHALLTCLRTRYGRHCEPFSGQNALGYRISHGLKNFSGVIPPEPTEAPPDPNTNFCLARQRCRCSCFTKRPLEQRQSTLCLLSH